VGTHTVLVVTTGDTLKQNIFYTNGDTQEEKIYCTNGDTQNTTTAQMGTHKTQQLRTYSFSVITFTLTTALFFLAPKYYITHQASMPQLYDPAYSAHLWFIKRALYVIALERYLCLFHLVERLIPKHALIFICNTCYFISTQMHPYYVKIICKSVCL